MGSLNLTLKYTIFYFAATSGFSDTEVLSIVSKFWILSTLKWKWKLFLKITLTAYVIFSPPLSFKFHVAVGEDGLDWEENVNFMPVFSGLEWMRTGWNCVWEQVGILEGSFSVWYSCGLLLIYPACLSPGLSVPVAFLSPCLVDSDGPAFCFTEEGSFIVDSEFSRAGLVEDCFWWGSYLLPFWPEEIQWIVRWEWSHCSPAPF